MSHSLVSKHPSARIYCRRHNIMCREHGVLMRKRNWSGRSRRRSVTPSGNDRKKIASGCRRRRIKRRRKCFSSGRSISRRPKMRSCLPTCRPNPQRNEDADVKMITSRTQAAVMDHHVRGRRNRRRNVNLRRNQSQGLASGERSVMRAAIRIAEVISQRVSDRRRRVAKRANRRRPRKPMRG